MTSEPARVPARRSPGPTVAGLAVVVALAVLLVLTGLSAWWVPPLIAAAVLIGRADGGARRGTIALAAATAAGAAVVLVGDVSLRDVLVVAASDVGFGVLPWLLAVAWRARRAVVAGAAATLAQEQLARQHQVEADVARERLRIAGHLHDDLGHALSLVALNLGRLELDGDLGLEARGAVGAARQQVADAVERLGVSVQALRAGGRAGAGAVTGAEGADVAALVHGARCAGAEVEVVDEPAPDRVVLFGADTVVRVVREGLTNAVKHAPGEPIEIRFDDRGDRLGITVRNPLTPGARPGAPGAPATPDAPGGTGLRTLGEHVRRAGGALETDDGTGWFDLQVDLRRAGAGGEPDDVDGAAPDAPDGHAPDPDDDLLQRITSARRRGGTLLLVAALVPAGALALVAGAIQAIDVLEARRAELDSAAFARISVGDDRSAVEPLLPDDELDPPADADPGCDYYAVTADPLADAFADVYRICWTRDTVESADLLMGRGQ